MNKLIHRHQRFGFGLTQKELNAFSKQSFDKVIGQKKRLLTNIDLEEFKNMTKENKKALRKIAGAKMNVVRKEWIMSMMNAENIVHEKMVLFWHHHFACEIKNPLYAVQFSNVIRKYAIGDFKMLLKGITRSAAMIAYLNNRQNKKNLPNENFARELCEIFTLGRDVSYNEEDIQNIARAFTGWRNRLNGEFIVNDRQHDRGEKEIFGRKGNFNGDDVLRMILDKKECSYFISKNIYEYFVNPVKDEDRVQELSDYFYRHDYNIERLIRYIVNSDWFYSDRNVMCRIKSPMELLVGIGRQIDLKNSNAKSWLKIQKIYDQVLYKPRNVEGWKVNQEWIDSNSLPLRMKLASTLINKGSFEILPKHDYDTNPNFKRNKKTFSDKLGFDYSWDKFLSVNEGADLKLILFNNRLSEQARSFLSQRQFMNLKEECIQLMSLPEYQLA